MVSFDLDITTIWIIVGSAISILMLGFIFMIYFSMRKKRLGRGDKLKEQLKQLEDEIDLEKKKDDLIKEDLKQKQESLVKKKEIKLRADKKVKSDPDVLEYDDSKGFDVIKERKSKFRLRYWRDKIKNKLYPESIALINMELVNGFHKIFLVKEKQDGFKYRGKMYLFDNEAKYFIIDSKIWAFDYHESFTLPIKRKIPVTKVRKTLESSNISEVEYATNPATLERFAISKIAEGIMRGAELEQVFKFLKLMSIIIASISVFHLILFMAKTGIFQQIKIPGIN